MTIFIQYDEDYEALKFSCPDFREERDFLLWNLEAEGIACALSGSDVIVSVDDFNGIDDLEKRVLDGFDYANKGSEFELELGCFTFLYSIMPPADCLRLDQDLQERLLFERSWDELNYSDECKSTDDQHAFLLKQINESREGCKQKLDNYYQGKRRLQM